MIKKAFVSISMASIEKIIKGGVLSIPPSVPDDATVLSLGIDHRTNSIDIAFAHKSFVREEEGCESPFVARLFSRDIKLLSGSKTKKDHSRRVWRKYK